MFFAEHLYSVLYCHLGLLRSLLTLALELAECFLLLSESLRLLGLGFLLPQLFHLLLLLLLLKPFLEFSLLALLVLLLDPLDHLLDHHLLLLLNLLLQHFLLCNHLLLHLNSLFLLLKELLLLENIFLGHPVGLLVILNVLTNDICGGNHVFHGVLNLLGLIEAV